MPKFRVEKGHDAWQRYVTIVEADSAEEAEKIAGDSMFEGEWVKGGVSEFDDYEIMEGDTEQVADDEVLEELEEIAVTPAERDMIIAALRHWQQAGIIDPEIANIARNGRDFYLSDGQIDKLCGRING